MEKKERSTSETLAVVVVENRNHTMSVGDIKNSMHERGIWYF